MRDWCLLSSVRSLLGPAGWLARSVCPVGHPAFGGTSGRSPPGRRTYTMSSHSALLSGGKTVGQMDQAVCVICGHPERIGIVRGSRKYQKMMLESLLKGLVIWVSRVGVCPKAAVELAVGGSVTPRGLGGVTARLPPLCRTKHVRPSHLCFAPESVRRSCQHFGNIGNFGLFRTCHRQPASRVPPLGGLPSTDLRNAGFGRFWRAVRQCSFSVTRGMGWIVRVARFDWAALLAF